MVSRYDVPKREEYKRKTPRKAKYQQLAYEVREKDKFIEWKSYQWSLDALEEK